MINMKTSFALLMLSGLSLGSGLSAGCGASTSASATDSLLANEVPTHVTKSKTGDFFVDSMTDIGWSTRVSVALHYSEASSYCESLGKGWRLPTVGELETTMEVAGKGKSMRPAFRQGLPTDGLLFSGEEVPVIDDDKQPLVLRIKNGKSFNGHGREAYVRCANGPVTREKRPFVEPPPAILGERWWQKSNACPDDSVARGTPGLEVSCKNAEGEHNGQSTRWAKDRRMDTNYLSGELHGSTTRWRPDGLRSSVQNYREGKLHGSTTRWRPDGGKIFVENYRNGELHGDTTRFRADGQPASTLNYRSGELHGLSTHWYPNGKKSSESEFHDGVLNAVQQRWNNKGVLQLRTRYRKGRIVEQLHYDQGKPRHGAIKQKHRNGVDSYVGTFKKGRALGQHYGYYENGRLRFERNHNAKGVPHGVSADWHPDGKPREMSTFKNGSLQGERVVSRAGEKTRKREN